MNRIFGLVIFTMEGKNLRGQWRNNLVSTFQPETATRNGNDNTFEGTYNTRWTDTEGEITANLAIRRIGGNQFTLNWDNLRNSSGNLTPTYTGVGTQIDGQLVCAYLMI